MGMKPIEKGAIFMGNLARLFSLLAEQRGASQAELGRHTGFSQAQISRIFARVTAISVAQAYALAEALDVDIVLVVAGAEWMTTKKIPQCLTPLEVAEVAGWFDVAAKQGWDFLAEGEAQAGNP